MRAVLQRVSSASVTVDGREVGAISHGLLALVGIVKEDGAGEIAWMAEKIVNLRVFEDEAGKMNLSVRDVCTSRPGLGGGILLVPNFTVAGDARKGRRPSFDTAKPPGEAEPMFAELVRLVREAAGAEVRVETGVFRATMRVSLVNEGPVTVVVGRGSPEC